MRILIVTVPLPSAANHTTMAPLERQIDSLRALGIHLDILEIKGYSKIKYLQAWSKLRVLAAKADLIHAHFGYCGWLARSQFQKPVIISFMGDDLLGTPNKKDRVKLLSKIVVHLDRWFARTVDSVIVKSAEMANVVKPVKSHIVPNGVDMEAFRPISPQKAKAVLGWSEKKRYILFPGNPGNPRKGFSLAKNLVMNASRQMSESLELVALNCVAPDQVPFYMNACDAMVMTSSIEGSPNVVKEAMACNLPTVAVPVGDVSELLNGVAGCIVGPRDPQELGKALTRLLNDGQRSAGRLALKQKGLDLESVAQKIKTIYEHIIARNSNNRITSDYSKIDK